jgi:hypothetical protein
MYSLTQKNLVEDMVAYIYLSRYIVDQTYFNETSLDSFQCISDNDTVFNKREGLYTERIIRTCIEHQILRVTYLKRYFLVLSSS